MKNILKYKDYFGSINFDSDELIFHGKLEFIRALVSFEATTAKGLKKAFENAVDDYLSTCKAQNTQPEKPFKGSLNIRLGQELHRDVALAAAHAELSINKFIAQILSENIKRPD